MGGAASSIPKQPSASSKPLDSKIKLQTLNPTIKKSSSLHPILTEEIEQSISKEVSKHIKKNSGERSPEKKHNSRLSPVKQANQIQWDDSKELSHDISRPVSQPNKPILTVLSNPNLPTYNLSNSQPNNNTLPQLLSSSSATVVGPQPNASRPSTSQSSISKPSGPPSRPRGPPPGVPVKPFPISRSDTDMDLVANFSDNSEPLRPTSPATVPPLNLGVLKLSSPPSHNSSTNSISQNSSFSQNSSANNSSTNSIINNSSTHSINKGSFTQGNTSSNSALSNQPHIVKETQLIKRNRAHIPTNLNHAQPTGGDWLKKRYIVNNYILLDLLGTGSYGEVKLCKDRRNENLFAIKIINKDFLKKKKFKNLSANNPESEPSNNNPSEEENFFEDIRREIAIMKKLHHPNILRLYEVLDDPKVNKLYLVLEYVKKGDLLNVLKTQKDLTVAEVGADTGLLILSDSDLWNLFRQLVSGIRYLHHQGICHGDIKPQNLLVTEDGVLKIADFGISQMLDSPQGEAEDGVQSGELVVVAGTPAFMAPELCMAQQHKSNKGQPSAPIKVNGFKADIWAIGATMFMLRVGRPPFVSRSVIRLYEKIVRDPIEYPKNPPINPGLENLLNNLLDKNLETRYSFDDIMKHPWYSVAQVPSEFSVLSSVNKGQRPSVVNNQTKPTDGVRFQPPSSYDREEAIAMTRPIQTVDKDEVFLSIGGIHMKKKPQDFEDDEEEEVIEDVIPLEYDTSFDKDSTSQNYDVMDTRWGEDVFEIVDEDIDDDDDEEVDDDESMSNSSSDLNLKMKKKSSKNLIKNLVRETLPSVASMSRMEMTTEEQQRRSKQFQQKARRSTENMDTIKESEVSNGSANVEKSKPYTKKNAKLPKTPKNTTHVSKNKDVDDDDESETEDDILTTNPLTQEEFSNMMDTLNMQSESKTKQPPQVISPPLNQSIPSLVFPSFSSLKSKEYNKNTQLCLSYCSEKGCRSYQEDRGFIIPSVSKFLHNENLSIKKNSHSKFISKLSKELTTNSDLNCHFDNISIVCIFDGHSGWRTSEFLNNNFLYFLLKHKLFYNNKISVKGFSNLLKDEDITTSSTMLNNSNTFTSDKTNKQKDFEICLKETFILSDYHACQMLRENNEDPSGSTGIFFMYDHTSSLLSVAWIGDSQCVLSMSGKASLLNPAHRLLNNDDERNRIKSHGGVVINNRVNGVLAVSRAFGDLQFKTYRDSTGEFQTPTDYYLQGASEEKLPVLSNNPSLSSSSFVSTSSSTVFKSFPEIYTEFSSCILTSQPIIAHTRITPGTEFAIIATDGLWDAMSYQRAVTFVRQKITTTDDIDQITKLLCQEAISRGSVDNVTAVIVTFH